MIVFPEVIFGILGMIFGFFLGLLLASLLRHASDLELRHAHHVRQTDEHETMHENSPQSDSKRKCGGYDMTEEEIRRDERAKTIEACLAAVEARREGYKALHNQTAVTVCDHLTKSIKGVGDE